MLKNHLFPTVQTTTDEFLNLISEWQQGGLSIHKHSRMLQLAKRLGRLLGEDHNEIIDEALGL